MVYQSSDLESATNSEFLPTDTDETVPIESGDGGGEDSGSSGLSKGATIAIAVIVPVVVLALLGALFLFWRSRRRLAAAGRNAPAGLTPYGEMQQKAAGAELAGNPIATMPELPTELHNTTEPVELPADNPTHDTRRS